MLNAEQNASRASSWLNAVRLCVFGAFIVYRRWSNLLATTAKNAGSVRSDVLANWLRWAHSFSQLVKKSPAVYGTRRFIAACTRARDMSLPCARSIKFTPSEPISLRSIILLSPHLHLGLPSGLFPWGSRIKMPCALLLSPIRSTYSTHPIHPNDTEWAVQITKPFITRSSPSFCFVARRPTYLPHYPVWSTCEVQTRGTILVLCVFKYQVEDKRFFAAKRFMKLLSGYNASCQ